MSKRLVFIVVAILTLGSIRAATPALASPAVAEYRLQAAFLLNFARFAQWPATTWPSATSPLIIGVLGRDPFGGALAALQGQTIGRHPVRVRHFASSAALGDCQLLYISASEAPQLDALLRALRRRPILLVSDIPRFAERGGHIQLFNRQNKLRFRVNLRSLAAAKLTLSSKLLQLADLVGEP